MARTKPQPPKLSGISIRRRAAPSEGASAAKASDLTRRLAPGLDDVVSPAPTVIAPIQESAAAEVQPSAIVPDAVDRLDFSALPPATAEPEASAVMLIELPRLAESPEADSGSQGRAMACCAQGKPSSEPREAAGSAPVNGHKKNGSPFFPFKPLWASWWS